MEKKISMLQASTAGDYNLDTENAIVKEVEIGENKGFLVLKGRRSMLLWHNNEMEFLIRGFISEEDDEDGKKSGFPKKRGVSGCLKRSYPDVSKKDTKEKDLRKEVRDEKSKTEYTDSITGPDRVSV